jgi:hypothetical protein
MEVNCAVADDNGSTDGRGWETIQFRGRSLMELGNELAQRLGDGVSFQDITLFIQAGNLGQPTLLLTDLPHRDDRVDIVVFRVGTAGEDVCSYLVVLRMFVLLLEDGTMPFFFGYNHHTGPYVTSMELKK